MTESGRGIVCDLRAIHLLQREKKKKGRRERKRGGGREGKEQDRWREGEEQDGWREREMLCGALSRRKPRSLLPW